MLELNAPANLDVGFTLICAAIVFLMQAGFCLLESGLMRTKNSINVAVTNVMDTAVAMLLYTCVGFPLMYGVSVYGLCGTMGSIDFMSDPRMLAFFLFQMVFCSTSATIVSGAIAERTRLAVYLGVTVLMSGLVYPLMGHWVWGGAIPGTGRGWLAALGLVDWAGCAAVHVVGGFASLAAAMAIGPRRNYVHSNLTGGHSLTLAILGTFLLWFGWWGFNGGSCLAADDLFPLVLVNTNLGAASGTIAAAAISYYYKKRIEVIPMICGLLAGLVSVTASCHAIHPLAAIAAGAIGAWIAYESEKILRRFRIDDAVAASPVHGAVGLWGLLVFGLFGKTESLSCSNRLEQISVQLFGGLVVGGVSFTIIYLSLRLLNRWTHLRVKAAEERVGLNMVEHGATNEVVDLIYSMSQHRVTGDISNDLEFDKHTEAGQIAGEYNRVLSRIRDEIGDHQQTNQWLQSEQLRLQSVLENAGIGIYQLDREGRFQSANPTLLHTLGYDSMEQWIGRSHDSLLTWHSPDSESGQLIANHFRQVERIDGLETSLQVANKTRWILESLVPIKDAQGALLNWLGTVHDITLQKQTMIAEIEIAEAKSQAKGEFLANMSHEIRTPLNGVIGMLELLSVSKLDEQSDHYVSIARSSADCLLALVNDVLDFSKIESGKLELESAEFELRELVESTTEQFAMRVHAKGVELNCKLSPNLPYVVTGDSERLRQVLINLLSNAIKFTDRGEINVTVSKRGSVIRFGVQDTGVGIPESVQSKLFQSFVQADASTTRKYGGTGLGLAISGQLVRMMGGQLKVDSQVGEGSEFWFEIELDSASAAIKTLNPREQIQQFPTGSRILIVDDNTTNCEILSAQLSNWGFIAAVCQESPQAVQRLLVAHQLGKPFDLVVLDFCMPEMDGRDVARGIRRESLLATTPIILLSSFHELLSKSEMAEIGIQIALTKPARQGKLLDSITSLLPKRPSEQEVPLESEPHWEPADALQEAPPSIEDQAKNNEGRLPSEPVSSEPSLELDRGFAADVLVAEDNEINQMVIRQMLESLGCSIEIVVNGQEALSRVKSAQYQMVLMDGHMPIMDGLTATRQIRDYEASENPSGKPKTRTPIVALTANAIAGVRQQCLDAGMDDYLCKPITLNRLREVIDKFVVRSTATEVGAEPSTEAMVPETTSPKEAPCLVSLPPMIPTSAPIQPARFQTNGTRYVAPTFLQSSDPDPTLSLKANLASPIESVAPSQVSATKDGILTSDRNPASSTLLIGEEGTTLFEPDFLKQQCGGDPQFERQILTIMRDSLPKRMEELKKAHSSGNLVTVRTIAHQLKGAAGDSSLVAVHQQAGDLETEALNKNSQGVTDSIDKLSERIDSTLSLLNQLLG